MKLQGIVVSPLQLADTGLASRSCEFTGILFWQLDMPEQVVGGVWAAA